ncbi:MAG TPA: molybdopterin cofactor-binding domain-containing protein, partial [Roseiarcus sp.]|nr:molybdopterin cofactor-binding domain-containing protein [Roseiarcus sp.]
MRLRPSRRAVLIGGGALGLLIGVGAWRLSRKRASLAGTLDADGAFLHDWIHVGRDGVVTLRTGLSEMGQGALTGVATLVAEELGCRLEAMRVETGPASDAFKNIAVGRDALAPNHGLAQGEPSGLMGAVIDFVAEAATMQITGGSSTIVDRFTRARRAGAAARAMLVQAAARRWGVEPAQCAVRDGAVVHAASKRSENFGDLALDAAKESPPAQIALKPREEWTLIGAQATARVDIPEKIDGSAKFGVDVRRPGMLFAAIAHCPTFGGALKSVDEAAASGMPGVVKIVSLPSAVAAVADSTWRAKRALAALKIVWDAGPAATLDSAAIAGSLAQAIERAGKAEAEGDFAAAYASAPKKLVADYSLPYLAHATMEPMNCTAEVGADFVEVWAPTQAQSDAVAAAAKAAGVGADKVRLHTTYLGGGFGRRLESDTVAEAVRLAKVVGKPVQVLWSREEDIQHDFYRPAALVRAEGGLDATGRPTALRFAIASQSILARVYPAMTWIGPDPTQVEGAVGAPYAISGKRVDVIAVDNAVPVGPWRSVGHSITAFAKESFIDEMAHEAGADPLAFRLAMLADEPRLAALLRLAADKAGWGTSLGAGRGRGIALHASFQSAVAEIVEVSIGAANALRVERVIAAVDCGTIVNPDIVRAQIEGAIVFALSAALFGKITIRGGRVEQ